MSAPAERPLKERLKALAAFLPEFTHADFSFGEWQGLERTASGALTFPFVTWSDGVRRFVEAAYEFGWVRGDVDWIEWKGTPGATALRDDRSAVAGATPDQLAKLLTVVIREDRFVEGALNSAYASGLLTAIIQRAATLAGEIAMSEKTSG